MAILKCKMCGGELNFTEGASTAECAYCGSLQTVPKADDEKKMALFARANRLRALCDFDKAAGIYETIVADFPEEAEAYWCLLLCKYGIEYVDDPASLRKIPTCHRSSFDSVMDDSDFELAMEYADPAALRVYREEAKQIEQIRKGIIAVSSEEAPYDIFICYKETDEHGDRTLDSVLAQDIYGLLTDMGYRVFFSRITLEDKLGREYEPYIFAALNSARLMLVFGTDYAYFNAVWVKNEWSRFLKLMAKDRNKYLIPCYKNIDAYDMPKEFAKLQAQDLGKLGATQDLMRGIEKLLPRQKAPQAAAPAAAPAVPNAMVMRGQFALDDGEWKRAETYFERALDENPADWQAYLGKVLAGLQLSSAEQINDHFVKLAGDNNYERAIRFATGADKDKLERIQQIADRKWLIKRLCVGLGNIGKQQLARQAAMERSLADFKENAKIENGVLVDYTGKLLHVAVPQGITVIGHGAFAFRKLLTTLILPEGVTTVQWNAFLGCSSLTSVTLPDTLTAIENRAFAQCAALAQFRIPESVTALGTGIFEECPALKALHIPAGVTAMDGNPLYGCENLEQLTVARDNPSFTVDASGNLLSKDGKTLVGVLCSAEGVYRVPEGVSVIGKDAFAGCKKLTQILLPDSLTAICSSAFAECTGLRSMVIPAGVTAIDSGAFYNCSSLTGLSVASGNQRFCMVSGCLVDRAESALLHASAGCVDVSIPEGITKICSFTNCPNLRAVTIPDSVTELDEYAFAFCNQLESIRIPGSVAQLPKSAFCWCERLSSVTLCQGVTQIGEDAFHGCEALTCLEIPQSVKTIGKDAFDRCKDLVIYTPPGSFADRYARENQIRSREDEGSKQRRLAAEAAEKRHQEEVQRILDAQRAAYRAKGCCQYCGGQLKGFFSKKCADCGRPKDY